MHTNRTNFPLLVAFLYPLIYEHITPSRGTTKHIFSKKLFKTEYH